MLPKNDISPRITNTSPPPLSGLPRERNNFSNIKIIEGYCKPRVTRPHTSHVKINDMVWGGVH